MSHLGGDNLAIVGQTKATIELKLAGERRQITHLFVVTDKLQYDILLGTDFLRIGGLIINFAENTIKFANSNKVACSLMFINPRKFANAVYKKKADKFKSGNVHAAETFVVPARCSFDALITLGGHQLPNGLYIITCPDVLAFKLKIATQNTLINKSDSDIYINVTNFGFKNQLIKKGTIIAEFESISETEISPIDLHCGTIDKHQKPRTSRKQVNNVFANIDRSETKIGTDGIPYKEIFYKNSSIRVGTQLKLSEINELKSVLNSFPNLFNSNNKVGNIKGYLHSIDTGPNEPISCTPSKTSPEKSKMIDSECTRLLERGVIRPVQRGAWASRTVLVKRKDGRPRLCIDYRPLNRFTKRDVYPLPSIDLCIEYAKEAKYYTSLDLNESFHQISLDEASKEKTAFVTPSGNFYEYNCLPFGLANSPSSFCRALDTILSGLKPDICVTYVDDLLIFARNFEDHIRKLKTVLTRLDQNEVTIGLQKCLFAFEKLVWGGRELLSDGIRPPLVYTNAVNNFPRPTDIKALRSFLGLTNYGRQYIQNYATHVNPLTSLLKSDAAYVWTDEHERCFLELKSLMTTKPVLQLFNSKFETELHTDASYSGIGGMLTQKGQDGKWHPVAFYSRKLQGSENNYTIYALELLAATECIEVYGDLLEPIFFTLVIDNSAVSNILRKRDLPRKVASQIINIENFNFEIQCKPTTQNKQADSLSRYPQEILRHIVANVTSNHEVIDGEFENSFYDSLRNHQKQDDIFGLIIEYLLLNNKSRLNTRNKNIFQYQLNERNILSKYVTFKGKAHLVMCIPKEMRTEICYAYHDTPLNGHLGFDRTYEKIATRVYFTNMRKFVKRYVESCVTCQLRKRPKLKPAGYLQNIASNDVLFF